MASESVSARERVTSLYAAREAMETEMASIAGRLSQPGAPGLKGPLVRCSKGHMHLHGGFGWSGASSSLTLSEVGVFFLLSERERVFVRFRKFRRRRSITSAQTLLHKREFSFIVSQDIIQSLSDFV